MLSAVMLIGSSVFSLGSVVFPVRSLVGEDGFVLLCWVYVSPVTYASRVNKHVCAGGGGGVM